MVQSRKPDTKQIDNALSQIMDFLNNIEGNTDNEYFINSTKKILKEIDQYRVRFTGITRNGKKIIYCNFIHTGNWDKHWKEAPILVEDGGYWFWQIEYDIESNKCINFYINGVA